MSPLAPANGIEIAFDEIGDPAGEPMLLVMGLGMQLVHWDEELCTMLVDGGYRVIRLDNRDAGLSSEVDAPVPSRAEMLLGLRRGSAYTLEDMADDLAALLDHLELSEAHLVGASLGGMIAQVAGYRHPDRVASLGLIMTGSGKRVASIPRLRAFGTLLRRAPEDPDGYADHMVELFRTIGSTRYRIDEGRVRELARLGYERSYRPEGIARQLHAVTASGDRTGRLRSVRAPTVVIHGAADPLIRPAAARSLAAAIPGAELDMIPGMGHDLPREVWPRIVEDLDRNARRAAAGLEPAVAAR